MKKHQDKKCSICDYIPDDDDINFTNYKTGTCESCGREQVCDLCLYHVLEKTENGSLQLSQTRCPNCEPLGATRKNYLGERRKEVLDIEYN